MSGDIWVPEKVFVEVHTGCSGHCRQCYQVQGNLPRGRSLSVEDAIRRIRLLQRDTGSQVIPVTGEVLDHPAYLETYRVARWTEYLVTNGRRLLDDPSIGCLIAGYGFRRLRISAHYFCSPEGLSLAPCGSSEVSEIVRAAGRHSLGVEAFCLIGTFNFRMIREIYAQAEADGLERLWLLNLMPVHPELRQYCLSARQTQEVFRQAAAIRSRSDEVRRRLRFVGNFGPRPGSPVGQGLAAAGRYCPAGVEKAYVTVDGSVYGCHFLLEPRMRLGRLEGGHIIREAGTFDFDRSNCYHLLEGE
ncbi:hypothetical protein AMJ57_00275 [Parcubacteria bacterium SG8_24]|nr:MAG: hypothetical protein AMJ57_00275 [Parcubacteria bacterium SG8_24]